ncbi:MAG: molybdopterin molybdenumtransferase MoeA [Runella slithyformis]|nr:MAG: molybdopterin molybdenumtransferase MoeA [Runella slithyformis]TAF95151.1 MAG: molybdopterin molybdenumtransferase MoeA [Runella sp.]TAG20160.1 MAG: molybdopterin molybdenumtransferase MoeA [Cytophagales bacterium]TAG39255.1 MAG: molybdopterin molybdenumtransferase MoeA [Cytophagia bacterium]TAF29095.1 MAG: molybdopterin molybdenumtransferase MoeA [Runella slithyformis]
MLTVEEAYQIVLDHRADFSVETVALADALGRMLREPLLADRNFPPFDRVTMDGVALCYETWQNGQTIFGIENTAAAGKPQQTLQNAQNCVEVMTGAMLPAGTDTVLRYEDLAIKNGTATIQVAEVRHGQNVHYEAQDRKMGELIVPAGRRITPAELGVAASVGKAVLKVATQPRAVIISTGDELIAVDKTPLPHQIRTSNGYALQAALRTHGVQADNLHLPDNAEVIEQQLALCLEKYDFILFSGGVSAGKFDFVPAALDKCGVKKIFHKVAQRPGKPFWFGQSLAGKAVFALPGNPVSTFMCLHRYVLPWLQASLGGVATSPMMAALDRDFTFEPPLTYFLQVKLSLDAQGVCQASPVTGNGSGDLANLVDADAFLELPQQFTIFSKGTLFKVYNYR